VAEDSSPGGCSDAEVRYAADAETKALGEAAHSYETAETSRANNFSVKVSSPRAQ